MAIKKRYILRSLLIVLALIMVSTCAFVMEQYYRLQICNLSAYDGMEHSYNI